MALDPLRFAIEIADEASQKIKAIKEELNKLEPKIKVTFDESSINVAQLRTALENAIKSLGEIKVSGAGINISGDALGGAADKINEAKEAIKGGRFGELAKRINEATTELERLTKAFETFQLTIGKDKGLKDFMTGLGEVISNVKTKLGALDKVSNSETSLTKTSEKIETNRRKFNELIEAAGKLKTELKSVNIDAVGAGFDNPVLKNALRNIDEYINGLRRMREEGKVDFSSNHQISEMVAGFNRLKSALSDVGQWQSKLTKSAISEGLRTDAQSAAEATRLFAQWSESIRRASVEYTDLGIKIAQLSDKEKAASAVGVDTTKLKDQINALKVYRDTLKEISDGSRKHGTAQEFVRRADYETAIKLAQREGDVVMQTARERARADKQLEQSIKQAEENQNRFNRALFEAQEMMKRLTSASSTGAGLNLGTGEIDQAIIKLRQYIDQLLLMDAAQFNATGMAGWKNLSQQLAIVAREQEKLNKATDTANQKSAAEATRQQAQAAKQAQTDTEKWAESMRVASIEATKLEREIRELKKVEKKGSDLGIDTTNLKSRISQLEQMAQILRSIEAGMRIHGTASSYINSADFKNAVLLANEEKTAIATATREKEKAASATSQLTAEEQRLAQALNQTTEHARGQSQVLSDLKSMAMQYLGVWGGQQFLRNIIEIGGQLEMQRLSIGAILQNQSQANDLFERIKGLAVQSPFGVVELDQMTKQLTAYGFKYNELFDMTKRLADISAATGTGVDRLALALGHVRSEAALSGYTLRQFSMANVPLLQKLSEKLGKTTQEIRKMVRAKEVSYEDVIGVLQDITNEGGMFYNMQEVISQSVKAKFKNVKDAMDIMYGEMAEGYIGDSLKGVADALMEVTRNWKDAAMVLGTGAALWAAQRVAVIAYTAAIGKNNAAVLSSIASYKAQQAQALKLAWVYRERTAAEMQAISTSQRITAMERLRALTTGRVSKAQLERMAVARQDIIIGNALALSQGKLTAEDIAKQVATAKLTKTEARRIIILSDLSAAEKTAALNAVAGVRTYGRFTGVINGAALAAQRLGLALKSLIFNPAMLGMAAIAGIVELLQRNNAEMERAKELGDAIFEASQEGLKNARQMMQNTGIEAYQSRDGKLVNLTNSFGAENESVSKTFLIKPEFDPSTAQQIIEEWSQYIREYSGTPNKMLNDALLDESGNVRMLKDQFDQLYLSVEQVIKSQKGLASIADIFQMAQEDTGSGWLNEDIVEDIKDYDKTLKSFNKTIITTFRNNGRAVKAGIDSARQFDANFAKNTEGMTSYGEMLKELVENYEKYGEAVQRFNEADYNNENLISDIIGERGDVRGARKEMLNELNTFISGIQSAVEAGEIVLDDSTKNGLMAMFESKFLGSLGNISDEAKKELRKRFAEAIGAVIDDTEETTEKRLADWQIRAGKVFEINKEIKVKTKTITDISEFAKAVQEDLKKKQDYIKNNASHINHVLNLKTSLKLDVNSLNDQIIALSAQVQKLVAQGKLEAAKSLNSIIQDELLPYRDAMMAVEENKKWLKSEGYPETEAAKDKSKNKSKSGSKKAYKDEEVEKWKKRVDSIKEAYSEYSKMEKEIGDAAAIAEVKKMFDGVIDEKVLDDIKNYKKYIVEIQDLVRKRYESQKGNKKYDNGKQAEELLRRINKLVVNINMDELARKSERWASGLSDQLEQLTRRWEIFNSVREATGDRMLAEQLAGFGDGEKGLRNSAEAMKRQIESEIASMGNAPKIPIELDINASDSDIQDNIKNALGGTEYEDRIKGITDAVKKWRDAMRSVLREDIQGMGKLMGSVVSYAAQIKKIDDDLAKTKEQIANSGATESQQRQMTSFAEAQADWKKMKLSADYSNLYNKTIAMSRTEFEKAANAVQKMIDKLRDLGAMSPDEYLQEVDKINKARMEWSTSGFLGERGAFGNFISGGNDGLMNYYAQRRDKALQNAEKTTDSEEKKKYNQEAEHYGKLFKRLSELSDAAKDVMTAFQTLQSGIDLLGGLFDSLGMEGAANAMSDAGGILGGALQGASSLSALGPYGMAAGAAIGLIGGIAQVHDKSLERHINKLREDVKGIEANTELIVRSRERTLGYDMGDVRRQMAQQYATPSYSGGGIMALIAATLSGSQKKSMYDYYMQNSQGTGYEQEYANLVEQREKYMEILKDQQDKKKKSNEEIEETKSKIAELDDQIRYFSQDLAKELWGIDIKGWADQLSDALASAFENGENMAKAYRETVTSILQQMMQKMMQMQILEPMFANLQKDLFGENGKGGVFDPNNPKGSLSKVTKIIGDYFGKGGEGEKAITASMEFMTAFQRGMQSAGLTVLNEASNTLSSGIQGTSEETSDLLAGYVNALRQDVSVNRILLTQYVTQLWPQYIEAYTAQVTSVSNIDNNVRVIMEMMQLGNGAMYDQITAMRTRIDNIVLGIDRVSIR